MDRSRPSAYRGAEPVAEAGAADPMRELSVRAEHLCRLVRHFADPADPWFPRAPTEFVVVASAVADIQRWVDRTSIALEAGRAA